MTTPYIRSLADGLGIVVPVASMVWRDLRLALTTILDTAASLKEVKSLPALRKGVVPRIVKCPAEEACALNGE